MRPTDNSTSKSDRVRSGGIASLCIFTGGNQVFLRATVITVWESPRTSAPQQESTQIGAQKVKEEKKFKGGRMPSTRVERVTFPLQVERATTTPTRQSNCGLSKKWHKRVRNRMWAVGLPVTSRTRDRHLLGTGNPLPKFDSARPFPHTQLIAHFPKLNSCGLRHTTPNLNT